MKSTRDYTEIKEVRELESYKEVNKLLELNTENWLLLQINFTNQKCYKKDIETGRIINFDKIIRFYIMGRV